jgi:hypothetical protein
MPDTTPTVQFVSLRHRARAVAAGNNLVTVIGRAPCHGTIIGILYTTVTAIAGAAPNSRDCLVVNEGTAGVAGIDVGHQHFLAGVNTVQRVPYPIPLSAIAANLWITEGDVLVWYSTAVAAGLADPGGNVEIVIQPHLD